VEPHMPLSPMAFQFFSIGTPHHRGIRCLTNIPYQCWPIIGFGIVLDLVLNNCKWNSKKGHLTLDPIGIFQKKLRVPCPTTELMQK